AEEQCSDVGRSRARDVRAHVSCQAVVRSGGGRSGVRTTLLGWVTLVAATCGMAAGTTPWLATLGDEAWHSCKPPQSRPRWPSAGAETVAAAPATDAPGADMAPISPDALACDAQSIPDAAPTPSRALRS